MLHVVLDTACCILYWILHVTYCIGYCMLHIVLDTACSYCILHTSWSKLNDTHSLPHECSFCSIYSNAIFCNITLTAINSGRGCHVQLSGSGPRTGALFNSSDKRVPTDHRPSKRSILVRRFRSKTTFFSFLFLNRRIAETLRRAPTTRFAQIFQDLTA